MTSNNNPQHPLQTSDKSGLVRSAPIQTMPQISGGTPPPLASNPSSYAAAQMSVPTTAQNSIHSPPKHTSMDHNSSSIETEQSNKDIMQPHVVPLPPRQENEINSLGIDHHHQQQQQQTYINSQPQQAKEPLLQNQQPLSSLQPTNLASSPPQTQQNPIPQQQNTQVRRSTPSTPDEEVDAFLLNTLGTKQSSSKFPYETRPASLPQTDNLLDKAKLLATRRAWGDVIRVTNDALIVKNAETNKGVTHHDIYSQLIAPDSPSKVTKEIHEDQPLATIRRETCELITLRCIAHLKLRRYDDLGKEITQLGLIPYLPPHPSSTASNNEVTVIPPSPGTEGIPLSPAPASSNVTFTHSLSWKEGSLHSPEEQDRLPSWVPYGLRILAAQTLQYVYGSSKAIDVLYDMRDRAVRTEYWSSAGMDIWCSSIDNALVNVFARKREWRLALSTLDDMLNGLDAGVVREVEWFCKVSGQTVEQENESLMKDVIKYAAEVELMSRQILILLQCGALDAAKAVQTYLTEQVARIDTVIRSTNNSIMMTRLGQEMALVRQAPFRVKVNEGLLLFANGKFTDALNIFRDAMQGQKNATVQSNSSMQPLGCPSWKELSSPTLGFDSENSLTVECLNNISLCLLYSGNMRWAVYELEGLVREDPTMYLTEGMAFNLCTLYELGSDGEECTKRKKTLQRVAKRFFLHDVGVESFRLN